MLSGHAVTLSERSASGTRLIEDVAREAGDEEEEADAAARVVYRASFQELMRNYLQYDTIIWALISLLLVLAWGIGLLLLLYLPYKRYVLKRDILSRQLFVTENKIVYKVTRPSYWPFMGTVKKEIKVPLHLILDVIIEQGELCIPIYPDLMESYNSVIYFNQALVLCKNSLNIQGEKNH